MLLFIIFILIIYIIKSTQLSNNFCKSCFKCKNGFISVGIIPYKQIENVKIFVIQIDYKNELSDFSYLTSSNSNNKLCEIIYNGLLSESYNFNITPSEIASSDYVDIPNKDHKYRCYFVNILENIKIENKNLILINEKKIKNTDMFTNKLEKIFEKYYE